MDSMTVDTAQPVKTAQTAENTHVKRIGPNGAGQTKNRVDMLQYERERYDDNKLELLNTQLQQWRIKTGISAAVLHFYNQCVWYAGNNTWMTNFCNDPVVQAIFTEHLLSTFPVTSEVEKMFQETEKLR